MCEWDREVLRFAEWVSNQLQDQDSDAYGCDYRP